MSMASIVGSLFGTRGGKTRRTRNRDLGLERLDRRAMLTSFGPDFGDGGDDLWDTARNWISPDAEQIQPRTELPPIGPVTGVVPPPVYGPELPPNPGLLPVSHIDLGPLYPHFLPDLQPGTTPVSQPWGRDQPYVTPTMGPVLMDSQPSIRNSEPATSGDFLEEAARDAH